MAIQVEVPGHGLVEFPDGMSDDQISAAIRQNMQSVDKSWGDVAGDALSNAIPSTGRLIGSIAQSVMHPLDTAKSVLDIGAGALQNALPDSIVNAIGADKPSQELASKVGQFYKQRYGSEAGLKEALSNDPAGVAADAATILSGGAGLAAKVPHMSKVANALRSASRAVDPLANTVRAVGKAGDIGGLLAKHMLGTTTGAGGEAISQAYQAGKAGGSKAQSFADNMRGNVPMDDVLNAVDANLAQMGAAKTASYKADMAKIGQSARPLPFAPIEKAVRDAMGVKSYKGVSTSKSTADIQKKISDVVQEWKALDPADYHTAEGFDALKQSIGDLRDSTQFGTPERRVADAVYHAVKNEIVNAEPLYAKAMSDYSKATELAKEIRNTLSNKPNASVDTQMRKLQSLMRNNVNTNYGNRLDLVNEMVAQGGKDVLPAIAGQALNSWTPRGLQSAASVGAALVNPASLAAAPMLIPRVAGETAFKAGQLARALKSPSNSKVATSAADVLRGFNIDPSKIDPRILANALYQMQQPKEQQ